MSKMDQFVEIMKVAFALSMELKDEGINRICWDITYYGTTDATTKIASDIGTAMKEAGLINVKEGAA